MNVLRIILCLFAVIFTGGCSDDARGTGPLRVGMDLTYAPFELLNDKGEPDGAGYRMAESIAKKLNRKLEIVPTEFPSLIAALEAGRVEMVVSSMTITESRGQRVRFSKPYLRTGLAALVRTTSDVKTVEQLNDPARSVIYRTGTTGEDYAKEFLPKAKGLGVKEDVECVLALMQGLADAFVYDQISLWRYQLQNRQSTRAFPIPERLEYWGVAFGKDNDALQQKVNAALDELTRDGILKAISERYLDKENEMVREWKLPSLLPEPGATSF